jgi:hypothetical protein
MFNDPFSDSVAVSVSLAAAPVSSRLLNVPTPPARFGDVFPDSRLELSVIVTVLVAAVAVAPLSVSVTTGAGDKIVFTPVLDGGSVVNDIA